MAVRTYNIEINPSESLRARWLTLLADSARAYNACAEYLADNGIRLSVKEVQEAFGFENPQAIYKWKRGEPLPSIDNLVALAVLLHTTVDKIVVIEQ